MYFRPIAERRDEESDVPGVHHTTHLKDMKHTLLLLPLFFVCALAAGMRAGELRLSSNDLNIPKGSTIIVDHKKVGTAPCGITLTENIRHVIETRGMDGNTRTYNLTAKTVAKTDLINNVPMWFFTPSELQPDFPGYSKFVTGLALSESVSDAIGKAQAQAKKKSTTIGMNRYNVIRESDSRNMLDSSKSRNYPRLTRGQMDSLNDVNGGIMVTQSFGVADKVQFLEYEIQKVEDNYQVYVLAGTRKG